MEIPDESEVEHEIERGFIELGRVARDIMVRKLHRPGQVAFRTETAAVAICAAVAMRE
jgi:hypothetical protein